MYIVSNLLCYSLMIKQVASFGIANGGVVSSGTPYTASFSTGITEKRVLWILRIQIHAFVANSIVMS